MNTLANLSPIAAFDIRSDGTAVLVVDAWPDPAPGKSAAWRWLHCDRTAPGFERWAVEHLPVPVRAGLLQAETRPRCEVMDGGLLLTLRGINLNPGAESEDMVAIRLWATEGLVVTTRFRRIFAVDELRAEITSGAAPPTAAGFVARLAALLTEKIEVVSAEREEATDAIEEVLLDDEPDAIGTGERQISQLARSIIKLRRHIAPQREALSRLAAIESPLIGTAERYEMHELANRGLRLVEELDATRDRLASLRAHVDSLHAGRIGRQGFVLSVVAAIFLPLGFLTGLFGVNVAGMPGTEWPLAFVALTGTTIVLGVALWLVFRWLKWF
jgi:zinc transporter